MGYRIGAALTIFDHNEQSGLPRRPGAGPLRAPTEAR
jgi:hypothetical protein